MKKLLVLLFSLLFLFSGTKVFAAQGVDCQNIKFPNLSTLGFKLKNETFYDDNRLGVSKSYELSKGHITFYSFDNGYDFINQDILDSTLASGVRDIYDIYKLPKMSNYQLQDDAQYLNMGKFNEFGMQEFINQGVFMTAIGDVSTGVGTTLEITTIGTDGKCMYKVRSSTFIPLVQKNNLKKFIQDFEYALIDFYRGFIAINDISSRTSNLVLSADFQRGLEAAQRGDFATALREWEPLAEQGDSDAQYSLGFMYANGLGVPQDYKTAVKWYTLAAEQGNDIAQLYLGLSYALGKGVIQDRFYAYMWLNISDPNEEGNGSEARDRLAQEMTAADISKAQNLARECVAKNYKGC